MEGNPPNSRVKVTLSDLARGLLEVNMCWVEGLEVPRALMVLLTLAVQSGMVWYGMECYAMEWNVWNGMVWYGILWYGMVWFGMVW